MKIIILSIILLLCCSKLSSIISSIDNIRNEQIILDNYDFYDGVVYSYGDKLIVSCSFKIEEYQILSSGALERINYKEKRNAYQGYFDEERYYDVDSITSIDKAHITVYDLSSTPMEVVAYFSVDMMYTQGLDVIFTDYHMILTDSGNERAILVNKTTFDVDGYFDWFNHMSIALVDTILVQIEYNAQMGYIAKFSDFEYMPHSNNYNIQPISELPLGQISTVFDISIIDNTVVLACWGGVYIVSIDDIANPYFLYQLPFEDVQVRYALTNENYIFISTTNADLLVYDIDDYSLVFSDTGEWANFRNLHLRFPYLYMNKGYGLKVYDISNGINEVYVYGHHRILSFDDNEVYYHIRDLNNWYLNGVNIYSFYSVFDTTMICSFESEDLSLGYFKIRDNYIYVIANDVNNEWFCYMNIYEIDNQQLVLMSSFSFNNICPIDFHWQGNRFYINQYPTISVYDLNDFNFTYIGSFTGRMPSRFSNNPHEYVLNYVDFNNRIIIRDIDNFENILLNRPIANLSGDVFHYDENVFIISNTADSYIYNFTIENSIVDLVEYNNSYLNVFNRINTKHNYTSASIEFYTISDYQERLIGEYANTDRLIFGTYFFPERNKMVKFSNSSLKVYDFEYTEYVPDGDIVVTQPKIGLLRNYPNPFNPTTTIEFSVQYPVASRQNLDKASLVSTPPPPTPPHRGGQNVTIDIYNIKGQKVRSLVDGLYEAGEHSVVWNGKDDAGREVGSGIYFYRMKAGDYSATRKMVLMK